MSEKKKEPVALWKGIVGTALSAPLFVTGLLFVVLFNVTYNSPVVFILFLAVLILSLISLILNIYILITAASYKKRQRQEANLIKAKEKQDKKELLHKLLNEGKITIEEYDELSKK